MKIFKYKFSKLTLSFIYIGIALCITAISLNVFAIITGNIAEAANIIYPIIQHTLSFIILTAMLALLIAFICCANYAVDDKKLKMSFGLIKSTYDISQIKTIVLNRYTGKLSLVLSNDVCFTILIGEDLYDEFIVALSKANPQIEYTICSKQSHNENNDKK